jgi:DNA-binding MarR family transcriptional regulator
MPQFTTLMRLYYHGACGVSDVSAHLDVSAAAASQLVDKLVKDGYLARTEDQQDRRAKHLTLTEKGRQLVADGIEARNGWTEQLVGQFSADEQATIGAVLGRLTEATRKLKI